MEPPLGPSLATASLAYHEQNRLDKYPLEYRPLYYRRYVDDIFVPFKSSDHLKRFQNYLNSCHVNMPFVIEIEQNNKISFLDVNVIREQRQPTSVYRKPTSSGVYTHFDSFLHKTYEIVIIYTSLNICFRICPNWSMFQLQLTLLREIFQKNSYPENFIIGVIFCF